MQIGEPKTLDMIHNQGCPLQLSFIFNMVYNNGPLQTKKEYKIEA